MRYSSISGAREPGEVRSIAGVQRESVAGRVEQPAIFERPKKAVVVLTTSVRLQYTRAGASVNARRKGSFGVKGCERTKEDARIKAVWTISSGREGSPEILRWRRVREQNRQQQSPARISAFNMTSNKSVHPSRNHLQYSLCAI